MNALVNPPNPYKLYLLINKMEPLEALMIEERRSLSNENQIDVGGLKPAYDAFPYLYHIPYITFIKSEGLVNFFIREKAPKILISKQSSCSKESLEEVIRNLDKIERKYNVEISKKNLEDYLAELAKRALNYAKEKLPGFLIETREPAEVFYDKHNKTISDAIKSAYGEESMKYTVGNILEELVVLSCGPDQYLKDAIFFIKNYPESNKLTDDQSN